MFWPKQNTQESALKISKFYSTSLLYIYSKRLRKGSNLWKISCYWSLKKTRASYEKIFIFTDNPGSCKKLWCLFRNFWSPLRKIQFSNGAWGLGCLPTQFKDSPNITYFLNILESAVAWKLVTQLEHKVYYTRYQVLLYLWQIKLLLKYSI